MSETASQVLARPTPGLCKKAYEGIREGLLQALKHARKSPRRRKGKRLAALAKKK